jgi:hypothetical protein
MNRNLFLILDYTDVEHPAAAGGKSFTASARQRRA